MVDSLTTWAAQYRVDGFRFDLMGHHMKSATWKRCSRRWPLVDPTHLPLRRGLELRRGGRTTRAASTPPSSTWRAPASAPSTTGCATPCAAAAPSTAATTWSRNQGFITGLCYDPNAIQLGQRRREGPSCCSTPTRSASVWPATWPTTSSWTAPAPRSRVRRWTTTARPAGYTAGSAGAHHLRLGARQRDALRQHPVQAAAGDRHGRPCAHAEPGLDFTLLSPGRALPPRRRGHAALQVAGPRQLQLGRLVQQAGLDLLRPTTAASVCRRSPTPKPADLKALLTNPALAPATADIQAANAHAREMLAIRDEFAALPSATRPRISRPGCTFHNTGPNQVPGVIVMSISDKLDNGAIVAQVGAATVDDLDANKELIVVVFNANDEAQTVTVSALQALPMELHPMQVQQQRPGGRHRGLRRDQRRFHGTGPYHGRLRGVGHPHRAGRHRRTVGAAWRHEVYLPVVGR